MILNCEGLILELHKNSIYVNHIEIKKSSEDENQTLYRYKNGSIVYDKSTNTIILYSDKTDNIIPLSCTEEHAY